MRGQVERDAVVTNIKAMSTEALTENEDSQSVIRLRTQWVVGHFCFPSLPGELGAYRGVTLNEVALKNTLDNKDTRLSKSSVAALHQPSDTLSAGHDLRVHRLPPC